MKTEHKFIGGALAALAAAVCVVLGITTINSRIVNALFHKTTAEYSITLSSSNKVTSSGDVDQKTALGNNVKFTYSGVQSSTTGHATLNNDGKLVNKDWIRSITAFTCSFTTAGSLTAKTSFGGDVWNSGFVLESGVRYETGSNPYYLEISSSGVSTISTLKIEYSCSINSEAHEGEEVGDGLLGVVDFWDSSNSGDTGTSTIVNAAYVQARCYDTDDVSTHEAKALVSAVTASYVYQKRYGGIGLSSGNNAASLTLTLSTGIEPTSVVVIAGSQSPSKTLSLNDSGQSVSKNCTGITALNDTYTNSLTWNFESAPSSLAFTCAKSSKLAIYRIYLYGSSGPSFNTPDECIGFTVDAKNTEFKSSDVFDNTHGLTVTAHYSNSDAVTLGKGGEDGYSYVVRLGEDISSNVVDTSKAFNTQKDLTTLYVTVSYKDFIDYQYQINVAFARHLDSIEVNCETTIFNTTHKFEDYTNEVFVNLDYNKDSYNKTNVPYQDFSIYSISLSLLNPNGVSSSVSSPFGTAGTWTIKVTSDEDNSVYGELDITVNPVLVTTITVTGQNDVTTLQVDSTLQLNVSCGPEGATNKTVTWSSSNNSVATVNTNGLVTGKSEGTVRINATANDGSNVVGYIDLTITPKPAQSEIDADLAAGNNSMSCTVSGSSGIKVGTSKATGSMTITVGAGATKLSFYAAGWNGSNTSITLSGATIGTSNFSLTADSGISGSGSSYTLSGTESNYYHETTLSGITSETDITVSGNARFALWSAKYYTTPAASVYPTAIDLTGSSSVSIGGTSQLSVSYTPNDTTVKNVTYSSNATSIATVSSSGLVTGIAAGTAKITATAEAANNATVTDYLDITVSSVAVTSISLTPTATSIVVGATEQLTAVVSPSNASNKNVSWTSSNSTVASVSTTGLVTAASVGSATITVTTEDGNKTATCAVTVVASGGSGGASGTSTISVSDIPTTYNTSADNTEVGGYTYTVYNVASSYTSGAMQWKKSSGYIENTTAIEGLISITIDSVSGKSFSGTLYSGSSSSPSNNSQSVTDGNTYTFSDNTTYFKLSVGSSTGYTGNITLTYSTTPVDPTSITIDPSSAEIVPGGSKYLTVNYTPSNANSNKDVTWSRYSGNSNISVSSSGEVTVSSNATAGQSAVIRATLNSNSSIYSQCSITVVEQQGDDQTILIYLCGSDLESNGQTSASSAAGYASGDITEILKVSGQPDDVNVVIETGGAKCWKTTHGINKDYLERYHVKNKSLVRDSQVTKANMGQSSTLQSFLTWGVQTYPADRISLILWNHGGAMRGVCYDENYNSDSLTNSEVKQAVGNTFNTLGRSTSDKFEWIGYDACLMQVQDIAEFNSQYFKYMIASEESEAGAGWDYDNWLDDAYAKKTTPNILKAIVDSFISEQGGTSSSTNDQTLSYLDLSHMSTYKSAWETMSSTINSMISSYGKSNFQTLMKTCKCYGSDSDCEGYSYFGIFDAKDVLNKLKNTSAFSGASTQINNVLTAFTNLVAYSSCGRGAGNSYGLCCFFPMKDGSGYTCNTSSVYTSSQTNFTNWRSIVTSYGD